jgi:hypothetical protein
MLLLPMGICERPDITTSIPQSLRELRERILEAIAKADESQWRSTWEAFQLRVDICRVINEFLRTSVWHPVVYVTKKLKFDSISYLLKA